MWTDICLMPLTRFAGVPLRGKIMITRFKKTWIAVLPAIGALLIAESAWATTRWDMNGCNPTSSSTSCSTTDGATVSAYSSGTSASSTINTAYVGAWNLSSTFNDGQVMRDVGVIANNSNDANSPQHSMDNDGFYDSMVLSFSDAVNLTEVQLGWRHKYGYGSFGDTDLSVLVYTGQGVADPSATPVLVGKTYAQLLVSGWELVGNYNDVWNGSGQTTTNESQNRIALGTSIFSSYWLVAAYNQLAFNPAGKTESGAAWDASKDYVKLLAVFGDKKGSDEPPNNVPEPSSAILLGLGLIGLWSMRRRAQASAR